MVRCRFSTYHSLLQRAPRRSALLGTALLLALTGCTTTSTPVASTKPHSATVKPSAHTSASVLPELYGSDDDPASGSLLETDSAWSRLRAGLSLDRHQSSPQIDKELDWYRKHPAFLFKVTQRSERYLQYVVATIEQRNMPAELALLPFIESAYDPFALSRSGASGLWQFIPGTGRKFGLAQNDSFDGRRDVVASTNAALNYLQKLHDQFNGDWLLAVAAYNFGEGNIQKAVDANRRLGKPTDFWSLSIREETRTYVPRLLALARIVENPHRYGVTLYHVPDRAYFASVDTYGPIDLPKAADLAGVSLDEMRKLNPGLRRATSSSQSLRTLLVPVDTADRFEQQLAKIPPGQRLSGQSFEDYRVQNGDNLLSISRKFGVSPEAIRSVNRLDDNNVGEGQTLLIPGQQRMANADKTPSPTAVASQPAVASHTVKAGETLWKIARSHGVNAEDIQRWNGLSSNTSLRPGQHLALSGAGSKTNPAPANIDTPKPKASAVAETGGPHKVGYTVQSGDSLFAIANRFNVQVEDIVRWNQVNPRSLHPGQKLTLYVAESASIN